MFVEHDLSTGGPCISYSLMGKRLRSKHPICKTHRRYFKVAKGTVHVIIWENVPQYEISQMAKALGQDWEIVPVKLDPQLFGLPCARGRLYILAWRKDKLRWHPGVPTIDVLLSALRLRVSRNFTCGSYWQPGKPINQLTPWKASCRQFGRRLFLLF